MLPSTGGRRGGTGGQQRAAPLNDQENHMYDMTVTQEELNKASAWWFSLSINQMKQHERKYFPHWTSGAHKRMVPLI